MTATFEANSSKAKEKDNHLDGKAAPEQLIPLHDDEFKDF
jgi:hypothetical protein